MSNLNNPIRTKCWEAFLKSRSCNHVRTKASHHHWKCPGAVRTITFRGAKKDVPRFHIKTNLKSLGISNKEFNDWVKENC